MLPKVHEETKTKNPQVRQRIASYFLLVLLQFDPVGLKQNMELVEDFLTKYLQDAKPEVRQIARLCFIQYKSLVLPSRSQKLQRSLTASNQRAIEEHDEEGLRKFLEKFQEEEALKNPVTRQVRTSNLLAKERKSVVS